jgi:hypothetical protein
LRYGYDGLGILTVRGIPGVAEKRAALLPLSAQFAALPREARAKYEHASSFYAFGWSHGKEKLEGRPDYAKGSFYANPQARRALAVVSLTCARGATHPWEALSPRVRRRWSCRPSRRHAAPHAQRNRVVVVASSPGRVFSCCSVLLRLRDRERPSVCSTRRRFERTGGAKQNEERARARPRGVAGTNGRGGCRNDGSRG